MQKIYLEEQDQCVTPCMKHLISNAIQKFVRLLPKYSASLIFFAVVPAERPLELKSKGRLTSLSILKNFNSKKRDVIEHYLEQPGPVCNTQRHEQDAMCDTSLAFLQKNPSSFGRALREKNNYF